MPAVTVDNPLVLPRIARPDADRRRWRDRRCTPCPRTTPSRVPASRCGGRSRAACRMHDHRPVPAARPARPGRVRARRGQGRALAPAPRLRDRHLRARRRDRAPRLQRRRRRDRRGRHAVDDRRRRHPPRRGADRARRSATAARRTACSCGSTCRRALKFTPPRYQAITGDNLVLLSSDDGGALVRLIAGDLAGHPGPGRHAHADHLRARDAVARARELVGAVEPGVQRARVRARSARATRAPRAGRSTTTSSWCSAPATRSRCAPPTTRTVRSTRARGAAARRAPDPRADRALRPVRDEHPRGDPPGDRRLQRRPHGHDPRRRPRLNPPPHEHLEVRVRM